MGTSRHKPKRCETCVFYKPSDLKGQGWCTHPKRQQSGGMLLLVRAGALDCRNSWGEDFWTPIGDGHPAENHATSPDPALDPPIHDVIQATATPPIEDHVVRQDATMNDDPDSAQPRQHDDEAINHGALSDQEERARVMARGVKEAIQLARERKKQQIGRERKPHVAPLPSADAGAGSWTTMIGDGEVVEDDVVLSTRHQAIDPFRRSYGDPEPPVPLREMPADANRIVSRARDDRFDSVPDIRAEVELPRPSHAAGASDQAVTDALDATENPLPASTELTSYDLVLQRARQVQRRGARPSRHAIRRPASADTGIAAGPGNEDRSASSTPAPAFDAYDMEEVVENDPREWEPAPELEPGTMSAPADTDEWIEADIAPDEPDDVVMPNWSEDDPDDPWVTAQELTRTRASRPQPGPRFRLPHLSLFRPNASLRRRAEPLVAPDDDLIVDESAWTAGATLPPASVTAEIEDPDWVEDALPVEAYAATQPEAVPADVSAEAYVESAWEDAWSEDDIEEEDEPVQHGVARLERRDEPRFAEPHDNDGWRDGLAALADLPPAEDEVTIETTVRHQPAPAPASLNLANLRARLFPHGSQPPDDDPAPGPGSRVKPHAPASDQHWSEPNPDFDLRAVVKRQDELLDMRIDVAPDVPRVCRTCRSFRATEGGERGWCTNEWAFSHRRMVNADDLPCESSIGCWWLPADSTWLPADDVAALAQPTPLVDRLLGRLPLPGFDDFDETEEEPRRARAR